MCVCFFSFSIFFMSHWAGGAQVLLAPPQFLLAPGKRAMLNVEPQLLGDHFFTMDNNHQGSLIQRYNQGCTCDVNNNKLKKN